MALYTGIVYDSGFFAYSKTSLRTFRAAIKTLEWGADSSYVYQQLMENSSNSSILLLKQTISTLEFFHDGKIVVQITNKEDLKKCNANYEDTESFVNIPLRSKDVEVSLIVKETPEGEVRCSMRSKGKINVSKVAQEFSGGGHKTAAGFKSGSSVEETVKKVLDCIIKHFEALNNQQPDP